MISFLKKKEKNEVNNNALTKIAALLIHAAKIDEVYTEEEREIIKKTMIELGAKNVDIEKLISDAAIIEENSNQILDFTREIKNAPEMIRLKLLNHCGK